MADIQLSAIAAGTGGFVIDGETTWDESGWSVSLAGDVNGDGLDDLIVGARSAGGTGRGYVVFGQTGSVAINLSAIAAGSGGFVIAGQGASDNAGTSVAAAGDLNGDGLADLIVGAYQSDPATGTNAGRSYVVFGKTGTGAVSLGSLGSAGFVINGASANDTSGFDVAGAGDVNGDGIDDLLIAGGNGRSHVVFGKTGNDAIDLGSLGSGGFVVQGDFGGSIGAAGDVNGDGLADLIRGGAPGGGNKTYVVFGKTDAGAVSLPALGGTTGFVINADCAGDSSGLVVAGAGDVNGDGLADLIIGAWSSDFGGETNVGRVYVVFGKTGGAAVELADVAAGSGGFVMAGEDEFDQAGVSVASAGDVNGDGLSDLIVGSNNANNFAGRSYVVFGKTGTGSIDLSDLAAQSAGFAIDGETSGNSAGFSVGAAGDVNGDGLADLIVGAPGWDPTVDLDNRGRSYVIFGATGGAFTPSAVDQVGTTGDDTMSGSSATETLVGNAGNDTINGNGGADVLYGGSGNDAIWLNSDNLDKLDDAVTSGQLARIDGGSGIDTLGLDGASLHLNLAGIANQGAGTPASHSRIESIERIDITGGGNNILTLGVRDVIDIAGMNTFNNGNGWTGLGAVVQRHQLVVDGDASASVVFSDSADWLRAGIVANGGSTYVVFNHDIAAAQVMVDADLFSIALSRIAGGIGGFVINGQSAGDSSGISVAGAGDVNGDGLADLIVGATLANGGIGRSYVVFGKTGSDAINLADIAGGTGGFVIEGQCTGGHSGNSVSSAGDVNGDGLADLIVGAAEVGRSYVVYGKAGTGAVSLGSLGSGGFIVNNEVASDQSGFSVAAAGDVNGDGLADLIVSAPGFNGSTGRSYVLFGRTDPGEVSLGSLGTGGFLINGQTLGDKSGYSVAAAGDVNGDGLADLIVGAPYSDPDGDNDLDTDPNAGRSYVVFGKTGSDAINLADIAGGTGGFVIDGQAQGDRGGSSVAGAGDVNGDGLADLVVGSPFRDATGGNDDTGRAYVVFGKTSGSEVILWDSLETLGQGFAINGECAVDWAGSSVAAAGDVNGDGLADVIIGAERADVPALGGDNDAGRSYVVFGKTGVAAVDLSAIAGGIGGFVVNGEIASDNSGHSVAAAGDVNGDGLADLIVGAPNFDTSNAGRSYVIFGATGGVFSPTAVDQLGGSGADSIAGGTSAETFVGGAGNDTLSGGGGADVLHGGAGDDTIVLNADNVAKLAAGVTAGQLARVDGGSGIDTLSVSGAGLTLDLTTIANQGGAGPGSASRIESIEKIDISGSGNNVLSLRASDVIDMAGMNAFNSGNGWTGLAAAVQRHQVIVEGDAGDTLKLPGDAEWIRAGTAESGGQAYVVLNHATAAAQLLVDDDLLQVHLTTIAAGSGGFVIDGETTMEDSGWSVAGAGDVNGDGLGDLLIGARLGGADDAGRSYVVFGQTGAAAIDLTAVAAGSGGFVLIGQSAGDNAGASVAAAGDVNGDGLADLIVGAYHSDPAAGTDAGRSYVVFGKAGTGAINLSSIDAGSGGFVINGASGNDSSGSSVSAAGDVNGDGLADVIVGAPNASAAYVVFGKTGGGDVELGSLGAGGFALVSPSGISNVASAGDVNADGLADLIVGAGNDSGPGRGYVVFGKASTTTVTLSQVATGSGGFVINGECDGDRGVFSAAPAGDVNGDGLADLVVGAPLNDFAASNAGRAYVVFGKTGDTLAVDLSAIAGGTGGFVMNGTGASESAGGSVAGAGDVNGDGLGDLIVGVAIADSFQGRTYVVFGKTGTGAINFSDVALGSGGFVAIGETGADSLSGFSVSAAGDVNGDGLADLLVGAPEHDSRHGRSYVIFGSTTGAFSQSAVDHLGDANANIIVGDGDAETFIGGAGADTIIGGGGADVLYGGAGRDVFTLNQSNVNALTAGATSGQLARIDGGTAADGIRLDGSGIHLNLTAIRNHGAGLPGSFSRIESIESIALHGSGNNTLTVGFRDVVDMWGPHVFNSLGTWSGAFSVPYAHLAVHGNEGDTLNFSDADDWVYGGVASSTEAPGETYSVFNHVSGHAQVLVDDDVRNENDAPTGVVTIAGTPTQGQVLTANNTLADADDLGTFSFQWKADGVNIGGATANTFTLTDAQVGKAITVTISYIDGFDFEESKTSAATAAVADANDAPTGEVTIGGTVAQGQVLTASSTLADLDELGAFSFQWKADGASIAGATESTFTLTEAQVGKAITVTVSYTDGIGTAESVSSGATALVANVNDALTGTVTIAGTPTQGETLTAENTLADVDGLGALAYQWKADGANIQGATASTFLLTEAQVGKAITVTVSYTDGHGTAESATSAATALVANVDDDSSVTITGTTTQGETLTAVPADPDGVGATVTYQWKADGADIAGATASTFVLTEAQVGKAITVAVGFTDGHGAAESATSAATAAVANVNDARTGAVAIAGPTAVGGTLTIESTLADPDGLGELAYQWKADGANIDGATASTYVLTAAELGKVITVTVSYTDGHGTAESATSAATVAIRAANTTSDEGDVLSGGTGRDTQEGGAGDDALSGGGGNDRLLGGEGDDTLDGGAGVDRMEGGAGDDTYVVNVVANPVTGAAGDVVVDTGGIDTVMSSVTYTLGASLENLVLTGTANINGTGNALANELTGNGGNNVLSGGAGNDTFFASGGNDRFVGGAGNDTLDLSAVLAFAEKGQAGGFSVTRPNTTTLVITDLTTSLKYTVSGAWGAATGDRGVESFVFSDETVTLAQLLENTQSAFADVFTGSGGADTMAGGAGNDTYTVDHAGDVVTELPGQGSDLVRTALDSHTLAVNVENLLYTGSGDFAGTGNAGVNKLTGGTGADTLNGGLGADRMEGGAGDDTYVVNVVANPVTGAAGDVVVDTGGTDTVMSAVTYALGASLENLVLTGAANLNGTGNALANELTGNAGNNVLNGGGGSDTFFASGGNDRFVGGPGSDAASTDTLNLASLFAFTQKGVAGGFSVLRTDATTLVIRDLDTNQTFTAQALESFVFSDQTVTLAELVANTGGAGADTLNAGAGDDVLVGGAGNDTYIVNGTADQVVEAAGQGTDLVRTDLGTYTLAVNVEQLLYTGSGNFAGSGNNLANKLTGGAGNDTLNGGLGADRMEGGAGNDTYVVNVVANPVTGAAGDVVFEGTAAADSGGTDTVQSAVSYTLGTNVENLQLTGSANINGTGNALANQITGNTGANTLRGGAGNDVFVFDNLGLADRIADFASGADSLGLEDSVFAALEWAGGELVAGQFQSVTSLALATAGMNLVYHSASGQLLYDADGFGTGEAADLLVTLTSRPTLVEADFMQL